MPVAVPLTRGLLWLAGESGLVSVILGAAGGAESSTYTRGAEHPEEFPAASVAVARNGVVVLLATETVKPGEAKRAAVPRAAGAPMQPAVL